jgi:signal transduction histidine kinase/ActR/RegA family two-component response regulator
LAQRRQSSKSGDVGLNSSPADPGTQEARWRFWITISLSVAMAGAVVALILLLVRANSDYNESLAGQTRSVDVITLVKSVDATVARGEAALARFAVGLNREDGQIYQQQFGLAEQYLRNLRPLVRDNPEQRALVRDLIAAIEVRNQELGDAALSANYRQALAAISKYYAASKDSRKAGVEDLLDAIIQNERKLLRERSAVANRDRIQLNQVIMFFSLLGAIAAIGGMVAASTVLRARSERRMAERESQADSERALLLERAVAERTRELAAANQALRHEIEERTATEAKLRQAQKMEAVGQLTGGIAHDFNNMLAVVVGGIELAQRWLADAPDKAARHLAGALEGAGRASDLTRRLLAFARAEPARPEIVAPDIVIGSFSDFISRTIGDRIALKLDLGCDQAGVRIDRQQFENALLNLAVNARDAMEGHGRLEIATARRTCPGTGDGQVELTVSDTGCGMTQDVIDRIFDPFFTTKATGRGTGLGMSQVFAFVRSAGGEITVNSTPGAGTSVVIALPLAAHDIGTLASRTEPVVAEAGSVSASLTILVVEDDPRVLVATVEAVTELGHRPVACSDPREALRIVDVNGPFDLVLSDVLMPEMTGPEMIAELAARRPDIAALFVTGFAGDASEMAAFGDYPVLRKPYTLTALEQAIHGAVRRPVAAQ